MEARARPRAAWRTYAAVGCNQGSAGHRPPVRISSGFPEADVVRLVKRREETRQCYTEPTRDGRDALKNVQFVMKDGQVFKRGGVRTPGAFFPRRPGSTAGGFS
jgi:hypothetical protein